jgi:glycosyltransferase involved in cell wall biosynthesis
MLADINVSVIITTYNASDYLRRVLDAYLYQTRLPDEVVVADDGSTTDTADVVEQFRKVAPFGVQHVWHEDQGFRAAKIRNEAIKASRMKYLVFTDGDCIPHRCFVADHINLAHAGWFVQGKRMLISELASTTFKADSRLKQFAQCIRGELQGCHHMLRIPGVVIRPRGLRGIKTCNFALHRKAALAVNGFNEAFVGWGREDAEFAARLYKSGLKRKDPLFSALVFHLWHPENSRQSLDENDRMLVEVQQNGSARCLHGIEKP